MGAPDADVAFPIAPLSLQALAWRDRTRPAAAVSSPANCLRAVARVSLVDVLTLRLRVSGRNVLSRWAFIENNERGAPDPRPGGARAFLGPRAKGLAAGPPPPPASSGGLRDPHAGGRVRWIERSGDGLSGSYFGPALLGRMEERQPRHGRAPRPVDPETSVTHVPGLKCYLCPRPISLTSACFRLHYRPDAHAVLKVERGTRIKTLQRLSKRRS